MGGTECDDHRAELFSPMFVVGSMADVPWRDDSLFFFLGENRFERIDYRIRYARLHV